MKLLYVGPLTPPIHGKQIATKMLAESLAARGVQIAAVDISEGNRSTRLGRLARKVRGHLAALAKVIGTVSPVYVSVNAGGGMWLTTLVALAARLMGRRILLHHHSYDYVRERRFRMAALSSVAGRGAFHIVLGKRMADQLAQTVPNLGPTLVLNNAGMIDQTLTQLEHPAQKSIVLGHLSNLTADKGVADVVRVAIAARRSGLDCRLVLAGPTKDARAHEAIALAEAELGTAFEYRGAVYGADKRRFFADITHFVFPTRYSHEASPLVLLEAMAAGVPCVATARGCIPDDLGTGGGLAIDEAGDFVAGAVAFVSQPVDQGAARERYRELLQQYDVQIGSLVAVVAGRD